MAKANRKAFIKLDARRRSYDTITDKKGRRRPGSMNPKKQA